MRNAIALRGCGPFFSGVGRNERERDRCPNREPEEQKQQDQRRKGAPQMPAGEQDAPRKNGDKGKEHGKNGGRPPGKDEGKGRFLRAEKAKEGQQGGEEDERPKDDVDGPFAAAAG